MNEQATLCWQLQTVGEQLEQIGEKTPNFNLKDATGKTPIPIYLLRYMIEKKKHELAELFNTSTHLQSPKIIQLSQELDELLNQYMAGSKR